MENMQINTEACKELYSTTAVEMPYVTIPSNGIIDPKLNPVKDTPKPKENEYLITLRKLHEFYGNDDLISTFQFSKFEIWLCEMAIEDLTAE